MRPRHGRRSKRAQHTSLAFISALLNACALSHPVSTFGDAGDDVSLTGDAARQGGDAHDVAAIADAGTEDASDVLALQDIQITPGDALSSDADTTDALSSDALSTDALSTDALSSDADTTDALSTDVVTPPTDVVATDVVTPPTDVVTPPTDVVTPPTDVVTCAAPSRVCGGSCVDVRSSLAHCGACDRPCNTRCVDGQCDDVTGFAVGTAHTCATLREGRLRCWGTNAQGQVGDGSTTNRLRPVALDGLDVVDISLGANHSCAVLRGGAVRCWGDNANGRLGDGTNVARRTPVEVTGLPRPATQVACGDNFTCARLDDGTLRCWGMGNEGQLGDGATVERRSPVAVSVVTSVRAVSAGRDFACAVLDNGLPYCWGHNDHGQLGDGTNTANRALPALVSGLTEVAQIAAADDHTCAIRTDGSAWCWGENNESQLGAGNGGAQRSPVAVANLNGVRAVAIGCGGNQCCVALADGAVRCWGDNPSGQLGDGTTTDRAVATAVPGLTSVVRVATRGAGHTCALRAGALLCWGLNGGGQLGDGTTSQRLAPAPVLF